MVLKEILDDNIEVHIKLYKFDRKRDMDNQFQIINGGKHFQCFESVSDQIIINYFRQHVSTFNKMYLSPSNNPRCPNINLEKMVEKMTVVNFIAKMEIQSASELIGWFEAVNDYYRFQDVETFSKWHVKNAAETLDKCKKKSPNRPLLLGMYDRFEWLDAVIRCKEADLELHQIAHVPSNYRERISKHLRRKVWVKRDNHDLHGTCMCCKAQVTYDDFECGHVHPVFYGGLTDVHNLEPICRPCNQDMGTQNLKEYVLINFNRIYPN